MTASARTASPLLLHGDLQLGVAHQGHLIAFCRRVRLNVEAVGLLLLDLAEFLPAAVLGGQHPWAAAGSARTANHPIAFFMGCPLDMGFTARSTRTAAKLIFLSLWTEGSAAALCNHR